MDALARMSTIPGVVGSLACDAQGRVIAQAFPPSFDAETLQSAARALAERRAGLEAAVGAVGALDIRFAGGRIVVRVIEGIQLLFLCEPTVNLQVLAMSAAGAAGFLARSQADAPARVPVPVPPPAPVPVPVPVAAAGGELHRLAQRIDQLILSSGLDRFKVRGQIAFKIGLSLDLIDSDTPDDPATLQKLRAVASDLLGKPL